MLTRSRGILNSVYSYLGDSNLYAYVASNPLNFTDYLGLRIDWGNYVISNPAVRSNLEKLNQALIDARGCDDFVLKVTGGDRFIDPQGNVRSSTTGEIVPGSDPNKTPHDVAKGARAADFTHEGLTDAEVDKALDQTTRRSSTQVKQPMRPGTPTPPIPTWDFRTSKSSEALTRSSV